MKNRTRMKRGRREEEEEEEEEGEEKELPLIHQRSPARRCIRRR